LNGAQAFSFQAYAWWCKIAHSTASNGDTLRTVFGNIWEHSSQSALNQYGGIMLSCHDVARDFLAQCDEDAGDLISNLKLQKLVYYAQGFGLALLERSLFPERIEAWQHGPVVPDLYHAYKGHGAGPIPVPQDLDFARYSEEERELLDEIANVYGQFSAWKLRNMTHEESPWASVQHAIPCEISLDSMSAFFRTRVQ
jgi:uncharacterized phage-associated protein